MFDVSKAYSEVPLRVAGETSRRLVRFDDPLTFPVIRKQLESDLLAIEYRLNMQVWGHFVTGLRTPTSEESSSLLQRFNGSAFDRDLTEAAVLRYLLDNLTRLEGEAKIAQDKEWDRIAAEKVEKEEREAFDAFEVREREKRFKEWRKS